MTFVVVIMLAALLVGLAKGGVGPVAGALLVPLLSTTMPVSEAVGITLPLLMVGDWFALRVYWRQWDTPSLRLMLPGAMIGIIMGIVLLTTLPDTTLRRVLGVFTLVAAGYKLASDSLVALAYTPRNWHGVLAGWGSGFGSALANAGAPPITAYMLLRQLPPRTFIGTSVIFFAIVNAIKLPSFLAAHVTNAHKIASVLWALPVIPLGIWAGHWMIERIEPQVFERLMLVMLVGAGMMLLLS